jgi:hypothetical protein
MFRYSVKCAFFFILVFAFIQPGFSFPGKTKQNQKPGNIRYLNKTFDDIDIQKDIKFAESVNEKGELEKS